MNRLGIMILLGVLLPATAAAQGQASTQAGAQASGQTSAQAGKNGAQATSSGAAASSASAQTGQDSATLASGTAFNAALSAPVDSKKAKPGDPVKGRTTEPCKSNGKTVLPKGTQLVGHVTQASARANGQSESSLGIVFDKAILKNGQEMPLNVAIQALASAESGAAATAPEMEPMGNRSPSAAPSGGGAGRGALGGVTNTVANTTNVAGNTVNTAAGGATNIAGNAAAGINGAAGGLNSEGQLTSNSRGVFGMNGLNLNAVAGNSTQGSLITSAGKNVHLDSGTKMLLVAQSGSNAERGESAKDKPSEHPRNDSGKPEKQQE
jgi:hypothetical protein